MELLTPRLRLRELREEDFDTLYAVLGDSDITRHSPYTFDESPGPELDRPEPPPL